MEFRDIYHTLKHQGITTRGTTPLNALQCAVKNQYISCMELRIAILAMLYMAC